jgi:hypothetical protein
MSEHAENLGRRVEFRRDRARLAAECEALRDSLRRALPVVDEVSTLDRDKILATAVALEQSLIELAGVDKKLHVLNRELGE